ncbi:MAG TPA: sigma-70 family RNA polymerase sigma factor [Gemmataceae bacterium]|nr:sigma-70 family RNA polymerase sigma factor [Gemmataceae bacterium]
MAATKQHDSNTDELLDRAAAGDSDARQRLLQRHRDRLVRMVAVRLDRRLAGRLDPSDVVQEALADADRKLSAYLRERPLPFYPWLRQLTWNRLLKLLRRHLHSQKRSVSREEPGALPDDSVLEMAARLPITRPGPGEQLLRKEVGDRVRAALLRLPERDRELLVLRYLEQLSIRDVAAVLGVTEGAAKVRHIRALQRLRGMLENDLEEDRP